MSYFTGSNVYGTLENNIQIILTKDMSIQPVIGLEFPSSLSTAQITATLPLEVDIITLDGGISYRFNIVIHKATSTGVATWTKYTGQAVSAIGSVSYSNSMSGGGAIGIDIPIPNDTDARRLLVYDAPGGPRTFSVRRLNQVKVTSY